MEIFTFYYRNGLVDVRTESIDADFTGEPLQRDIYELQSRLRGAVAIASVFGAGWFDPENHTCWEYGKVTKKLMKKYVKSESDCCGAKIEGLREGTGVCSECMDWCEAVYYIDNQGE